MNTPNQPAASFLASRTFTNVSLTAASCLLGVLVFTGGHAPSISLEPIAFAQQPGDDGEQGRISAAEQRKQIIAELKSVQTRLEKLETLLAKGIAVRVTEMPAREPERDK